jgi:HEAT repeat protein
VRVSAVKTLAALGKHAAPHVEAIIACLEDEDETVRRVAMTALGALKEHTAPHTAAIDERLLRSQEGRHPLAF